MRRRLSFVLALLAVFLMVQLAQTARADKPGAVSPAPPGASIAPRWHSAQTPVVKATLDYGRMPLYFIPNTGQMDSQVAYYVQGKDKSLYFTPEGVTFALSRAKNAEGNRSSPASQGRSMGKLSARARVKARNSAPVASERWVVKLDFVGANRDVRPIAQEEMGAVVSYFSGRPKDWHTGLPTYSRIIYPNLWPGIDLAYSGTVNQLK
jgi:hypothetical protein